MTISRKAPTRCGLLLAALIALGGLTGCSGGESGGGGQFAGIEGTGIVSGFGSVYVNGTEFATDDALILFNGERVDESRLRVGDVVRVSGSVDEDGRATASRIVFDRTVDGPIRRINTAADGSGELAALGQTVRFDADTHFIGRGGAKLSARDLSVGNLIAISGIGDASGTLLATSIERGGDYSAGSTVIDVEGLARNLDTGRFRIGNQVVDYDGSQLDAQPLAEGDYVQVFGLQYTPDGALEATRIERSGGQLGSDGQRVFVEGMISDLDSDGGFVLAGQRIDAGDAERADGGGIPLANGLSAAVEGKREGNTIVADTLALEPTPTVTLEARISVVDQDSNRVNVLGTDWEIEADTLYIDQSNRADRQLRLDRLASGETIRATGYPSDGRLVMTRLDRIDDNPSGNATLTGPVDSWQRSGNTLRIALAGTAIVLRIDSTELLDASGAPISFDNFVAALSTGRRITASGPDNGDQIDIARTIQLLD